MKTRERRILGQCKRNLRRRLAPKRWREQGQPMFRPANRAYELSGKVKGIGCRGLGAMALLVEQLGLAARINRHVKVLKRHLPYWESDHVLNMVYNILAGGTCLEDIELGRNNETYMDTLSAERIADPTTEGDSLRRFDKPTKLLALMEAINEARQKVWREQDESFHEKAVIDVDGTIAPPPGLSRGREFLDVPYPLQDVSAIAI